MTSCIALTCVGREGGMTSCIALTCAMKPGTDTVQSEALVVQAPRAPHEAQEVLNLFWGHVRAQLHHQTPTGLPLKAMSKKARGRAAHCGVQYSTV